MRGALPYSRPVSRQARQEEQMRTKFVLGGLVLAIAVTALALAGGGAARSEQEPFKVAFIYPGPHDDGGWSQAHDKGRLAIEKALGSRSRRPTRRTSSRARRFRRSLRASLGTATT